ncbi:P-type ATPase [Aspergillus sp. HF37]|nr:P-type ATPase [Aspergillus sp. HF37]
MADEKHDPESLGSGASPLAQPAHSLTPEAVLSELQTGLEDGLTNNEAKARLEKYGPNKLDEGEGISMIKILVGQVANAMMLVKGPISLFFSPQFYRELPESDPILS